MRVAIYNPQSTSLLARPSKPSDVKLETVTICNSAQDSEIQDVEDVNMANGWIIGWTIWAFIAGLNIYLIVMLGLGKS
jgi:Mn2+/Fe2+ NRAMP family transporter